LLIIILAFASCATTNTAVPASSNTENKQKTEKLRFDDWKYKGFGKELPYWADAAASSDSKLLKKIVPELNNAKTVTVLLGYGENSDQAEQSAKNLLKEKLTQDDLLQFFDSIWVRENIETKKTDMPYISIYILYKE